MGTSRLSWMNFNNISLRLADGPLTTSARPDSIVLCMGVVAWERLDEDQMSFQISSCPDCFVPCVGSMKINARRNGPDVIGTPCRLELGPGTGNGSWELELAPGTRIAPEGWN